MAITLNLAKVTNLVAIDAIENETFESEKIELSNYGVHQVAFTTYDAENHPTMTLQILGVNEETEEEYPVPVTIHGKEDEEFTTDEDGSVTLISDGTVYNFGFTSDILADKELSHVYIKGSALNGLPVILTAIQTQPRYSEQK